MNLPKRASDTPYAVEVEESKPYFWCACGLSNTQPFCDGSHKDTGYSPKRYVADKTATVYFCGCKQSKTQPLCDGSHQST